MVESCARGEGVAAFHSIPSIIAGTAVAHSGRFVRAIAARRASRHQRDAMPEPQALSVSPEQIAQARQMYLDGATVADIRRAAGMTDHQLYYWFDGGPPDGERHLRGGESCSAVGRADEN